MKKYIWSCPWAMKDRLPFQLFTSQERPYITILLVYVGDIIVTGDDKNGATNVKSIPCHRI